VRLNNLTKPQEHITPTALVLCGGASRGALEVGFYKGLSELDVRIDMILGTSIGAFNGAFIAGGVAPSALEKIWLDFHLRQAVSLNWNWLVHPNRQPGFFSFNPLRRMLRDTLPATRFEDLSIPLTIVTTDLETGLAVYWSEEGDLIEPIIASMSLPGMFPPIELDGHMHADGGIADNVPLDQAHKMGAKAVFLIECYCSEPGQSPPRGWSEILMRSFSITLDSKYRSDVDHLHRDMLIHRVHPRFDNDVSLMNFRQSEKLIGIGYSATLEKLSP
jgi:NTE family protein